jgi:general secretion pathway protein N
MSGPRHVGVAAIALTIMGAPAHAPRAAPIELAALDSAGPRGLGDIEQFPIERRDASPAPAIVAPPGQSQAQTGNPLWAVPLRALTATRERPIFSPSRRPPPAAVVVAPTEPTVQAPPPVVQERPALALVGTIIGEGESIAIFYNVATKTTVRLRLGDTDDNGWKLVAVDARTSLLEKGRQSVTLALPAPGEVPAAAGLTAAPRGGGNAEPDL